MSIFIKQESSRFDQNYKMKDCYSVRSRNPNVVSIEEFKTYVDKFVELNKSFIEDKDTNISKLHNGDLVYIVWFNCEIDPKIP